MPDHRHRCCKREFYNPAHTNFVTQKPSLPEEIFSLNTPQLEMIGGKIIKLIIKFGNNLQLSSFLHIPLHVIIELTASFKQDGFLLPAAAICQVVYLTFA